MPVQAAKSTDDNQRQAISPAPPLFPDDRSVSQYSAKNLRTGICHGRVAENDFEKMVPAQWWKAVFADGLYLKTDGDVVEDPEITKEELR